LLANPLCANYADVSANVLTMFYFFDIFSDFSQTNYLNIYWTDLHESYRIGRTLAVRKRSEVIFSIPRGTLPWQPILWAKSTSIPRFVVRMTFARAAPPAYDNIARQGATNQQ